MSKKKDSASHYLALSKSDLEDGSGQDLHMRTLYMELLYNSTFKTPVENPSEAERFFAELAYGENSNEEFASQISYSLFRYFESTGDNKKALKYLQYYFKIGEKRIADLLNNQLFNLEKKYQSKLKEETILKQQLNLDKKNKLITSLATGFILSLLLLVIGFFMFKNKTISKEKKLVETFANQLIQKTEDQRKRIASDLHDSVSSELVHLRHSIEEKNVNLKEKIDNILEIVRIISRNISPTLFDKIGLKASVEQLAERVQNQHQFFISSDIHYEPSLDPQRELQLYRIIQEAVTNILKHAKAVAGKITITEDSANVFVQVKDNGKGFNVQKMLQKGDCFGLLNITERTKFLGGNVQFTSNEKGTVIAITIPK